MRSRRIGSLGWVVFLLLEGVPVSLSTQEPPDARLPHPRIGTTLLDEALRRRRSVREYADAALERAEIGQLLWAAQGVTSAAGYRTAPSAGALYPLELYVVGADGVSHYDPARHALVPHLAGDVRMALDRASLAEAVGAAPVVVVITAVPARTAAKYFERAERYVHMEAGHAAQNLLLEAAALGLAAVPVGAFDDAAVARALRLPPGQVPLYLIPVGRPAR